MKCLDSNGYYSDINLTNILQGKKCKPFSSYNKYSLENIKKFICNTTNGEYKYISGEYKNAHSFLKIKHIKCGTEFETKWINFRRHPSEKEPSRNGTRCPFCEAQQLESSHALILKQVWLHENTDTIVEERSCINPITNCVLPTDIVNHRLKIAIEIQSEFHDNEYQKVKDVIKKNFWISKSYSFFALDQRDYSIIQMIQFFFPNINKIPDYINFNYSNKMDDLKAQKMLDEHIDIRVIAKELGCKPHTIYDAIRYKRLQYPDNYLNRSCSAVIQLDLEGNYISEYKTIKEAQENTDAKHIASALHRGRHRSGSYLWYYKNDYINKIA